MTLDDKQLERDGNPSIEMLIFDIATTRRSCDALGLLNYRLMGNAVRIGAGVSYYQRRRRSVGSASHRCL